jgi:hypothetical protein
MDVLPSGAVVYLPRAKRLIKAKQQQAKAGSYVN